MLTMNLRTIPIVRVLYLFIFLSLLSCEQGQEIRDVNGSLSGQYAAMRANQISNLDYKLSFILEEHNTNFRATNRISFDLVDNNRNPITIDFDQGEIESIIVNGNNISIDFKQWFITLAPELFKNGHNEVEITYTSRFATDGSGLHRFKDPEDGEIYLYSDFEPFDSHKMYPNFDQPDLKASYTLDVVAPKSWKIISTMRETDIKNSEDTRHWFFPITKEISSYVFSLHAGNYRVWEDSYVGKSTTIPLRLFSRQSLAKHVQIDDWFVPTKQSFTFFINYFEVDYPFGKYDQIIAPDFNSGAMENAAAVTFNEGYVSRGQKSTQQKMSLATTIAHEMAHMWFGDLVTMKWWNGLWLNESFATYMANLEIAEASDFKNNWDVFYSGRKQWAYRTDDSVNTHAIELPIATTDDASSNFDGITYGKGASVLKQIPYYLGQENFRIGVRNYLKKYSYKNTTLEDFMNELGSAAEKDLTQWTKDWLYTAGLNTIEVNYQCEDDSISELLILQSAPQNHPTLREQRVQIGLYNYNEGVMSLTDTIAITYTGKTTGVAAAIGKKCPDLVYPNEADWGYVKVNLDKKSLKSVNQYISKIENSMMRLMLWQSLSDSVKDGQFSAADFVDFAIANIESEKDFNVSQKIASRLELSLYYLDQATLMGIKDYSSKHVQVEALFYRLLGQAQPGSDKQKLWFNYFVMVAQSKQHFATLESILDGTIIFEDLTIDQDKRWDIVAVLNRYQSGNYLERLTFEAERDQSDSGMKNAIYAEVSRPDANVKKKWFEVLISNPDNLKLSTLRYIMWGLFPEEQQELAQPYRDRILQQLKKLNETDDLNFLRRFSSLIPTECTKQGEQALALLVEEYQEMKPQLLKTAKSKHENVGRCVNIMSLLK